MLLMDVMMPMRSGIDVARTLRAQGNPIPVSLLTASLDDHQLAEALDLGIEGIVLKESAQSRLLECLQVVRDGGRWIEPTLAERALAIAHEPSRAPTFIDLLSPREWDVVALVALGLPNREIATRLGITEGTIKVYLHRIYEKTGVHNRTELAVAAKAIPDRPSPHGAS